MEINYKPGYEKNIMFENGELPYFHYPLLDKTGIVRHLFTTRLGGMSTGAQESLNLSFTQGNEPDAVKENFARVAKTLGVECKDLVFSMQTHTTNVQKVGKEQAGRGITKDLDIKDIDGMVTNEPGIVLCTFYADCVPLYFVDPVKKAIGLCHSGWRGTVGRIGQNIIDLMTEEYGTNPSDLITAIGPSICQDCYEVSEDVALEFEKEFFKSKNLGEKSDLMYKKPDGKYQLNLWEANKIVLLDAGVKEENIALPQVCTCCNPTVFFSHRASNGKRGNLGAFLGLR